MANSSTMKFQIFPVTKYGKKEWMWRLRSKNGRTIATAAESYKNKKHCRDMIEKIVDGAVEMIDFTEEAVAVIEEVDN